MKNFPRFFHGVFQPPLVGWLVVLSVAGSTVRGVKAVPPPLNEQELFERSDMVGTVRVLGVACIGVSKHRSKGPQGEIIEADLATYEAWLQVKETEKGDVQPSRTILVTWRERPPWPGPICVPYYPGETVRTHLKWNDQKGTYQSTYWNAKSEPEEKPSRKLPAKKPGAVAFAAEQGTP